MTYVEINSCRNVPGPDHVHLSRVPQLSSPSLSTPFPILLLITTASLPMVNCSLVLSAFQINGCFSIGFSHFRCILCLPLEPPSSAPCSPELGYDATDCASLGNVNSIRAGCLSIWFHSQSLVLRTISVHSSSPKRYLLNE